MYGSMRRVLTVSFEAEALGMLIASIDGVWVGGEDGGEEMLGWM